MGEDGGEPLLSSRGVLRIEDFCRSTGLDQVTVENLMRTRLLEVSLWWDRERTRPFGIFDDALPSLEALASIGLRVRDDYDPAALRSFEITDDDPDVG